VSNQRTIKAKDVMTQNFIKLDGLATVKDAINAMRESQCEVVIVNKRDQHDAYGILLLSDIAKKVLAKDKAPERVNIYEVMTKPVIPVAPELDIRYCARLFDQVGLSCAPVIESEELLGLVSYKELLMAMFNELD